MRKQNRKLGFKKQAGQGMTEYIIIVALIAVAAIGVFTAFGGVVRGQVGTMAKELAGQTTSTERTTVNNAGQAAGSEANKDKSLKDYHSAK